MSLYSVLDLFGARWCRFFFADFHPLPISLLPCIQVNAGANFWQTPSWPDNLTQVEFASSLRMVGTIFHFLSRELNTFTSSIETTATQNTRWKMQSSQRKETNLRKKASAEQVPTFVRSQSQEVTKDRSMKQSQD